MNSPFSLRVNDQYVLNKKQWVQNLLGPRAPRVHQTHSKTFLSGWQSGALWEKFSICVIRCGHAAFLLSEGERLDASQLATAAHRPDWKSFVEINVYIRNGMILIRDNWLLVAGYTVIKPGGKTCLCVCCKITLISYVHLRKCVSDCGIMLIALIDFDCSFFSTGSRPPEKVTGSNAVWQNHTAKPKLFVKQLIKGEESNFCVTNDISKMIPPYATGYVKKKFSPQSTATGWASVAVSGWSGCLNKLFYDF